MQHLSKLWSSLFARKGRPHQPELVLLFLLVYCLGSGLQALLQTPKSFYTADAFKPQALGVRGVGWAVLFPPSWITSYSFNRVVALILVVSAVYWLLKCGLAWSPIVTALSYGLLDCLDKSRNFLFHHQLHAAAFILLVFAVFYFLQRREIGSNLKEYQFWDRPIYPRWVLALSLTYLGTFYGAAGVQKLLHGWLGTGTDSGVTLQVLCFIRSRRDSLVARLFIDSRPFAILAMTATLVLELGALVGMLSRRLRPWWSMGLIAMHFLIGLAMGIWFNSLMGLVVLMGFPFDRWLTSAQALLRKSGWGIWSRRRRHGRPVCLLVRAIYAFDVFGFLLFDPLEQAPSG
jgi:hypothetical protein